MLLVWYIILFCAAVLIGAEPPVQKAPARSYLEVGGGYTFLQMRQANMPSMQGHLGAFQASYIYQPIGQFYGGLTFRLQDGSIQSGERNKHIFDVDGQERVGCTFGQQHRKWVLSLFTGLGIRYISQTETWFNIAFSNSYRDLYIPVGFFVEGDIASRIRLGLMGQWRPQVFSELAISSRPGTRWVVENTLSNALIELPLTFSLLHPYRMYLVFKPFVDFWQEGRTLAPMKIGAPIPEQTFLFVGFVVNLGCSF